MNQRHPVLASQAPAVKVEELPDPLADRWDVKERHLNVDPNPYVFRIHFCSMLASALTGATSEAGVAEPDISPVPLMFGRVRDDPSCHFGNLGWLPPELSSSLRLPVH